MRVLLALLLIGIAGCGGAEVERLVAEQVTAERETKRLAAEVERLAAAEQVTAERETKRLAAEVERLAAAERASAEREGKRLAAEKAAAKRASALRELYRQRAFERAAEKRREPLRFWAPGRVLSVSFSPDGKRIVSGSNGSDDTLKVWDAQTGHETLTFKGHSGSVHSVSFSPDGKRIVSGGCYRTAVFRGLRHVAKVWDISSLAKSK
jgi:dipeptidyl aminopeptidase/acylaminoacyl peptidase